MSFSIDRGTTAAKSIRFSQSMMFVTLQNGQEAETALTRFPRLLNGTQEQREDWRTIGAGDGIHWPLLDEDISIKSLTRTAEPSALDLPRMKKIIELIGTIYAKSIELHEISGRKFTPDGLFVSTTGQVVAEYIYGLVPKAERFHDALTSDGRSVQIMLIGENATKFAVRWSEAAKVSHADLMLCLQLDSEGFQEIYNGEFPVQLLHDRKTPTNGQVNLSRRLLAELNPALLAKQHSFSSINQLLRSTLAHAA